MPKIVRDEIIRQLLNLDFEYDENDNEEQQIKKMTEKHNEDYKLRKKIERIDEEFGLVKF